jgi:CopG antitoxin of type II toxin-antitoxin system
MKKGKSSISKARSYAEIGEFWDEHDLSDYWGKTRKVKFDVVLEPEATYYPVAKDLSEKIQSVARKQGVASGTLVKSLVRSEAKGDAETRWQAQCKERVAIVADGMKRRLRVPG